MAKEVTNEDLAKSIDDLAQITAKGFDGVDKGFEQVDKRFDTLEQRFDILERKVDRALYQEIDKHERWIRQLAQKVGIELTR